MHPRWRYLATVVGAAAVVGLGWWLYPTDARRIRAACHELAASVSVPPQEPEMARLARVARLAKHLALEIVVEAEGGDARIEGRDQVMALAGRSYSTPSGVSVTLGDIDVVIGEDRHSADVRAVATVTEPDAGGRPEHVERRRLTMAWAKTEDGWRLARVVIARPDDSTH